MPSSPQFLFITCQTGAVDAVKAEIAASWPEARLAFSRRGFLTMKLPEGTRLPPDFELRSVFARSFGLSLGQVRGDDLQGMAAEAWRLYGARPVRRIHVWPRDRFEPGYRGFEPGVDDAARGALEALRATCPQPSDLSSADPSREPAARGDYVLDCVLTDPGQWWIGFHRTRGWSSRWPGGMMDLDLPTGVVSRAWLKMEEALRWSGLPIAAGARVAEIGSAPGGSSQSLLGRGCEVLGIDPAAMHADVLADPRFTHIRRRSTQVRRREFRKVRWLVVDMNVAPRYTLDAVESLVTHPEISIRGMILTLKLTDWALATKLSEYLDRVRSWGFNQIAARQLQHNRQELCVAALQRPFQRKT